MKHRCVRESIIYTDPSDVVMNSKLDHFLPAVSRVIFPSAAAEAGGAGGRRAGRGGGRGGARGGGRGGRRGRGRRGGRAKRPRTF